MEVACVTPRTDAFKTVGNLPPALLNDMGTSSTPDGGSSVNLRLLTRMMRSKFLPLT